MTSYEPPVYSTKYCQVLRQFFLPNPAQAVVAFFCSRTTLQHIRQTRRWPQSTIAPSSVGGSKCSGKHLGTDEAQMSPQTVSPAPASLGCGTRASIPDSTIKATVDSMPDRCAAVVQAHGGHTKHRELFSVRSCELFSVRYCIFLFAHRANLHMYFSQ
jgi:hypothetical protein